ncbi:LysR family transcriptional regulator [Cupriavidus gilardii]|uniref:LysR family transcriptional regulator n=1 Tax=Cupriavidus gilardii TaxID=82541 RepID=A0ABY4VLD7_9BURK|nr:LysR family transcriptional regulator [Cupriavidus gilardii]QQE08546.1 LysR family transcriptional regulator [Cupriavidus sp. ISTL7]MCT9070345.1 LysR family transcriptional regulator [Cupriavidus gilardii]MCT9127193.1 LysR family transcriptional regulator [Cupriavidus gilardii]QKS61256.1 LysR family transcriptional regulator [Cupriavidus gilardii]USE77870.1 LysR family transcriptional regulator [Cupriavidus gilardii]
MDKLLALKMFVETVDAKGFSAAARRLDLATSSVTRALDGLEQSLGAVLLNRSTRQVTVTEAGAAYYQQARRILEAVEEADALIADRGDVPVGQLRVSLPVAFGRRCIAPHLGTLLERYPQLDLEVTLTDDIVDLLGDRFDLSVRIGNAPSYDNVIARQIGMFRRHVVASPAYLQRHGAPSLPDDLVGHACLRFRFGHGARDQVWTFERDGQRQIVPVHGHFRSNNIDVLHELVLAGAGIGLLPDWITDGDIACGRLQRLFDDWTVNPDQVSSGVSALYLPNQRGSRRIAAFLAFLQGLPALAQGRP